MPVINGKVIDDNPIFNSLVDSRGGVTVRTFTDVNPRTIVKKDSSIVFFTAHPNPEQAEAVHVAICTKLHKGEFDE